MMGKVIIGKSALKNPMIGSRHWNVKELTIKIINAKLHFIIIIKLVPNIGFAKTKVQ